MAFITTNIITNNTVPSLQQLWDLVNSFTPPIDVRIIANRLGLSVIEDISMDNDISGCLENKRGQWCIYVNAFHNEQRKRFTIAHEIAHFVLHSSNTSSFKDISFFRSPSSDKIEQEANKLAAEILMPTEMYLHAIREGHNSILSLADKFFVSGAASQFRAKSLGLIK